MPAAHPSPLATPDDPADVVITLRIAGNNLVRLLNCAQARAAERTQSDLLGIIDQARDVLAEQRRVPSPTDRELIDVLVAFTAASNLGNTLCHLRDACRLAQDCCADSGGAERWRSIAIKLETLAEGVFDLS